MSTSELVNRIREIILKSENFDLMYATVEQYRDAGGRQGDATMALEKLLDDLIKLEVEEKKEDLLRDLLDFVSGYCFSDRRIWK